MFSSKAMLCGVRTRGSSGAGYSSLRSNSPAVFAEVISMLPAPDALYAQGSSASLSGTVGFVRDKHPLCNRDIAQRGYGN